jgi:hypothetical protein
LITRKNAAPLNSKLGWTDSYLYTKGDPLTLMDISHVVAIISLLIRELLLQDYILIVDYKKKI